MFASFNLQPKERPCVLCGQSTTNREWMKVGGSKRMGEFARCPGECEKETTAREARMLKQIKRAEKRMGAQ